MKGFRISEEHTNKFDKVYKKWVLIELEGGAKITDLTEAALMEEIIDMVYKNAFPEKVEEDQ